MKLVQWPRMAAVCLAFFACSSQSQTGITEQEIVVGQAAVMSGPSAELGQRLHAGIAAYFQAINTQGGVYGRKLRLVVRDDGYEPERAVQAVKQLLQEDGAFALVGAVGSPTGLAVLPVITQAKVPLIGILSGAPELREPLNRYLFHVRASYFDETEHIIKYGTTLGVKKIAVFYQDDAYGKAGFDGVTQALSKRNMKPVGSGTVQRNSHDVGAAVKSILATQPEAIVQVCIYQACSELIRQARAQGYTGHFWNISAVGAKALAASLGASGAGVVISQVVPFPFTATTALVRQYQQDMQSVGDKSFDFTSMEGYLIGKVFVEGLQRTGKNPTRESLIAALESMKKVDFGGFEINYSANNHNGSHFTDLAVMSTGGRFMH